MRILQGSKSTEIFVYGPIGEDFGGVSARDFAEALQIADQPINVRLNSPGGIVSEGWAIYQAIKRHEHTVTVSIDAEAASIASVIALAGDRIEMADHALMMVHHPWSIAMGNASDFRKMAETLDTHGERSVQLYMSKSGESRERVTQWMDEETWFTAEEAGAIGFVDTVVETMPVAAWKVPKDWFRNTPEQLVDDSEDKQSARTAFHRQVERQRRKLLGII